MSFAEAVRFFIDQATRFIIPLEVAAEWVILALAALAVACMPGAIARPVQRLRAGARTIGRYPRLAVMVCGLLPLILRLPLLGIIPVPEPSIHDEFSHLLLADTLAHGRLTNPTHPMWRHFESIHIIQRPTYNSMYPPAQGTFLGFGQAILGDPWAGVAVSVALMCACICWMMQAWIPPVWALFGTLIVTLKIGVLGFWINSYMGGAVPAAGGALLIGALPRLRRADSRPFHACLLGIGVVILMNSRPFEGSILTFASLVYLFPSLRRRYRKGARQLLRAVIIPAGGILACGLLFTGFYSWRVTGSPLRMPYMVNRDTYGWPENLAFLPPKKLTLQHPSLQSMYRKELANRDRYKTPWTFMDSIGLRLFDNWTYLIGPLLTVPLVFLPWVFRNRRTRPLLFFVGAIACVNLFQLVLYPYHLGPVVPVIYTFVAIGARHIYVRLARAGRRRAFGFAVVLPAAVMLVGVMKQAAPQLGLPLSYWERAEEPHRDARAYIQQWLSARAKQQLVIVRYSPFHSPDQEWVYNRADIDRSKVVWAREMDQASDAALLRYFAGREAWLLEADVYPQQLVPYARAMARLSQTSDPEDPVP